MKSDISKDNRKKNKKSKRDNSTEITTLSISSNIDSSVIRRLQNNNENQFYDIYKKIIELETKYNELNEQSKKVSSNISAIRKKENRLLNRFGWTLIMANVLLAVLACLIVLGYAQFIYPTIQKNIDSEGTLELIKWVSFTILGGIVTIWVSVMKFANYVRKRDQYNDNES